jgi:hypothetical protein
MTRIDDVHMDLLRTHRTGVSEAVFAESKTTTQLEAIASGALTGGYPLLFTRLPEEKWNALSTTVRAVADYDPQSRTAFVGNIEKPGRNAEICIVAAGTSDLGVALEARRTLLFHGHASELIVDVGVAGLWRLLERIEDIRRFRLVIAVAGMEGALFSVLAGLVDSLVIAVPTSVGYGVGERGASALSSALSSCAPGIVTVNIDNGFGAAAAALKIVNRSRA